MLGACCKERNNNFGGLPPQCPPGDWNVYTTDTDTCGSVFEDGRLTSKLPLLDACIDL